jgi:hypothetical protein
LAGSALLTGLILQRSQRRRAADAATRRVPRQSTMDGQAPVPGDDAPTLVTG